MPVTIPADALVISQQVIARPFTAGDEVVYRVGDASASLSSASTAVFLDEYSPTGQQVQSIPLPTSAGGGSAGSNQPLTASGSASSEGLLTTSVDGHYLLVPGYAAAPGVASIASTTAAAVNRVVGIINANGSIDTTNSFLWASGNNPRSVASVDGSRLYLAGGAGGLVYATATGSAGQAVTTISTTSTSIRQVEIVNGSLYYSTATGSLRIATISGLPTTTGQTATGLPGISNVSSGSNPASSSPYGFFFATLNGGSTPDTLYIADDSSVAGVGGIEKYSLVGGSWVFNNTVTAPSVRGLTGVQSGTTVTLYGSSDTTFWSLTDNSHYNGSIDGSLNSLTATITNEAFRGVAIVPIGISLPTVTNISPATGPAAGGTQVTITGTNFTGASTVSFGSTPATSVTFISPTQLLAVDPAGSGTVNVTVTTLGGTSAISTNSQFVYGASSGLPAWLSQDSVATYNATTHSLNVTGVATIISDPGSDSPLITATGTAAKLNITPTSDKRIHIGSLTLASGATSTLPAASSTPLIVLLAGDTLSIDSSSKLDLGNNILDIATGSLTTIRGLLTTGYSAGNWTGNGISSTTAAGNTTHLTALGYMVNNNGNTTAIISTIDGAPLASTDVLVKYTYYGDANLNGLVNGDDYSRIDAGFLSGTATGWMNGDFNYDAAINGSDYTLIDNAFNRQGTTLANPAAVISSPLTAVVESTLHKTDPAKAVVTSIPTAEASPNVFSDKKVKTSLIADVLQALADVN